MTENNMAFELGSELYGFNKFFEFPKDKQAEVILSLKKSAETIPADTYPLEVIEAHVLASYDFARSIDPNYKTWREKGPGYIVNPETERLLIDYYEMIKGKTRDQINEAVKVLETKILQPDLA